jgi:hypothetical protein
MIGPVGGVEPKKKALYFSFFFPSLSSLSLSRSLFMFSLSHERSHLSYPALAHATCLFSLGSTLYISSISHNPYALIRAQPLLPNDWHPTPKR